ncbi:hypothetical protein K449DRAFT_435125 [Hypoxylon sp. EC38]|nr:hypothetical protein K449DRAFT_435125 [Hypoxylon sp. EC38]
MRFLAIIVLALSGTALAHIAMKRSPVGYDDDDDVSMNKHSDESNIKVADGNAAEKNSKGICWLSAFHFDNPQLEGFWGLQRWKMFTWEPTILQ